MVVPRFFRRVRTAAAATLVLALFLTYEATVGPWRRHQTAADSYAKRAALMTAQSAREERLAADWARLARRQPGGDPQQAELVRLAATHRRRAWYLARLAADADALRRAHRRLSWLPWPTRPAQPVAPDPHAPIPPDFAPAAR